MLKSLTDPYPHEPANSVADEQSPRQQAAARQPAESQQWQLPSTAVLATMHRKEEAIAPLFQQELNINVVVPVEFDTDQFGTFTRDIDRAGTQIEAARIKAKQAIAVTGETLAIASEGAFFPHPVFPGIACSREIVLLLDANSGLEVIGSEFSQNTNFAHTTARSVEDALEFANRVGFPQHGLVVMPHRDCRDQSCMFRGIQTFDKLLQVVELTLRHSPDAVAHLETDMRAFCNPTRMQVIQQATQNLIDKIQQTCPACHCPGFDIVDQKQGLPCALCHLPTPLIRAATYRCQACHFQQDVPFPKGIKAADPGQCLHCNP